MRALVAALRVRRDEIGPRFARRLREVVPEYHAVDASDFQEAGWAALFAVVDGALDALEDPAHPPELPAELVAECTAAARHGMPWAVVDRTYHLTHRVLWEVLLEEVAAAGLRRDTEQLLLRVASEELFDWFDRTISAAGAVYERHRQQATGQRAPRTLHLVRQVLNGVGVRDEELGYRLAQQHVAVVAWGSDPQAVLTAVARATDVEVLLVQPGADQWWGWFGLGASDPAALRRVSTTQPGLQIALGGAQGGRAGFLASHQQARAAASLVARRLVESPSGVVHYDDVAAEAVALENETSARVFVDRQLAGLTGAGPRDEQLRATLLAYADAGLNAQAAARQLAVAERTVRYRLTHLEQVLGPDFRGRVPQLALAVRLHRALDVQRRARGSRRP